MTGHTLLTLDRGKRLHPVEVVLVSAALTAGRHVRVCKCGWLLVARSELEIRAMHNEHARAAAIAKGWT